MLKPFCRLAALPLCVLLLAFSAGCNLSGGGEYAADSDPAPALAADTAPAATGSEEALDPSSFILASRSLDNGHVEATFAVEGMTCGGCEGYVVKTVSEVPGVDACAASSKESTAVITYDPAQTNPEILLASLKSTGFELKPVNTEGKAADSACCGGCADKAAAKAAKGEGCCGGCAKDGTATTSASTGEGEACCSGCAKGEACNCQSGGECSCGGDCKCAEGKDVKTTSASKEAGCGEGCECSKSKDKNTQANLLNRLLAAAFPAAHAAETKPTPKKEEKKLPQLPPVTKGCERATFSVEYCCAGGCPPNTEKAVKALKGVAYVKADYPTLTCTVDFRPKEITKDKIKHAILDLGYPVDGEQPETPHED